jgi:hypothetical protein
MVRCTVLNLLRADKSGKHSLRQRQLRAALSDRYRERLLFGTAR